MTVEISKIDAARRQLDTAIRLYFNESDHISIHTLTCASHEIIKKIGGRKINSIMIDQMKEMIRPEKLEEVMKELNKAKNFFKHGYQATRLPIKFNPSTNDFWIWDCCLMYNQMTGEYSDQMRVYLSWFYAQHGNVLAKEELKKIAARVKGNYTSKLSFYKEYLEIANTIF